MLIRHLQLSLPEELREVLAGLPTALKKEAKREYRVIALVGAGASAAVVGIGRELANQLIAEERDIEGYKSELQRLGQVTRLDEDDLETQLAALSRTPDREKRVRQSIAETYRIRHPTLLTYELLAHLLKHRFLDAIVTLNFDELLDQSLSDELGEQEYIRIISERDCHGVEADPGKPSYTPIYMKLHGTARDAASLRFTRDAYYALPDPMAQLIRTLLGSETCVLLNLGSRMTGFDFNKLLDRPKRLLVFNLSKSPIEKSVKQEITARRKGLSTEFHDVPAKDWSIPRHRFPSAKGTDVLLNELVERLAVQAATAARPGVVSFRSVDRHRLVCGLLDWFKEPGDKEVYAAYLRDRATLEVALSGVRAHGLVSISSLVRDRCDQYFDAYSELALTGQSVCEGWRNICRRGGLQPSALSNETFVSLPEISVCSTIPRDETNVSHLSIVPGKLARHLRSGLTQGSEAAWKTFGMAAVTETLRDLASGTEVEIHCKEDSVCKKVFKAPGPIPTLTALHARTTFLLEQGDYNELAVVAESGEWLLNPPYRDILRQRIRLNSLRLYLVLAFDLKLRDVVRAFGQSNMEVYIPHWWRHNRHMTIICKNGKPEGGIYFARRLRSIFITPVYLDEEDDKDALMRAFLTYWTRSGRMPDPVDVSDLPTSLQGLTGGVDLRKYTRR
jgi:hypothetical protein